MKFIAIPLSILLLIFSITTYSEEQLIQYKIIEKSEMAHYKFSVAIEVPIIEGRLPNEQELGALSKYLVAKEQKHDRSFVSFYLPGMALNAGSYATAHHNPKMEVEITKYMLKQYPIYAKYAQ